MLINQGSSFKLNHIEIWNWWLCALPSSNWGHGGLMTRPSDSWSGDWGFQSQHFQHVIPLTLWELPADWLKNFWSYIEPITECVRKNMSHMQVFDALLSDLYYDWLNKWPNHDINQSYYGVRRPVVPRGVNKVLLVWMGSNWEYHNLSWGWALHGLLLHTLSCEVRWLWWYPSNSILA